MASDVNFDVEYQALDALDDDVSDGGGDDNKDQLDRNKDWEFFELHAHYYKQKT